MTSHATKSCPGAAKLQQLLDHELSEGEQLAVERHIETCALCQAQLDRLTATAGEGLPVAYIPASYSGSEVSQKAVVARASIADCPEIPGYVVRKEIGRGGRGVVYLADDTRLKRQVAVKVIRRGAEFHARELARFRTEAEAMARLKHPNIIPIYDIGEYHRRPYFAMEYLEGGNLGEAVDHTPQPFRAAAGLVETLARAMHHAHQRGVVHRDLKPGNVLLTAVLHSSASASQGHDAPTADFPPRATEYGVPKITDFGLAKLIDEDGARTGLTRPDEPMGTPSYMAPEQANGQIHDVGIRTDVYALGAVLYKLLTGHAPYDGASEWEIVIKVQSETQAPVPLRQRRPDLPRDLEAICLKCLEKDPVHRYASADQLADELRRYLNGEALRHTRPVAYIERMWRWARRNPAWATAACLALVLFTALVVSPFVVAYWERRHSDTLKKALRETQYQLAVNYLDQGINLCEQGNGGLGLLKLAQALEKTPHDAHDLERVIRTNLATWPDHLNTLTLVLDHGAEVLAVAYSPDGSYVLTGGSDGVARQWSARTGKTVNELRHLPKVLAVAYRPDGEVVATAGEDGFARLWNARTGEAVGEPMKHDGEVRAVAFSPDGGTILTGSADGSARLWDAKTATPRDTPSFRHDKGIYSVAFSPDGKTVLTGSHDFTARLWDTATGAPVCEPLRHAWWVQTVAFSPDGTILTGSGENAQRWDGKTGRPIGYPLSHKHGLIYAAAVGPDGRTVLTGSSNKVARLSEALTGKFIGQFLLHRSEVRAVGFSPDGRYVITGCDDGAARIWQTASGKVVEKARWRHQKNVRAVAFSPDGKRAATASLDNTAGLWDTATGALLATLPHEKPVVCVAFSPDGKRVLTGGFDSCARVWDAATGAPGPCCRHEGAVLSVTLSSDGRTALTGSGTTAFIWNVDTGETAILRHGGSVTTVAISPDGRIALTGSADQTARLWEVTTGRLVDGLPHEGWVDTVAFGPDGRKVLTGSKDNKARLWDVSVTPAILMATLPHQHEVRAVAFSPDGELAVTGSWDNTARIWEAASGKPFGASLWHPDAVRAVAFSPDCRTVITGGADRTVRLWDVETGKQLGPPLWHQAAVSTVAVHPSGELVLSGSDFGDARLWRLPASLTEDTSRVTARIQAITGMRLDAAGTFEVLDAAAWQRCDDEINGARRSPPP
jgi:WD40 repeat protein/serine/threonine protein kinase